MRVFRVEREGRVLRLAGAGQAQERGRDEERECRPNRAT
jgi:hypothetical protein